jgi:HlyD family secretion protein
MAFLALIPLYFATPYARRKPVTSFRQFTAVFLALPIIVGAPHLPGFGICWPVAGYCIPAAYARSAIGNLIARIRGEKMPDGIVKTNGRIEATQVDVSAKYAGRLAEVAVEEGSEVKEGQVVARISSPEYEAQLKAAQSNVQRTKEALTEAVAQIAVRQSALDTAKSDFDRGQELVKKGIISQQVFEQRRRSYESADASTRAATAARDQAQSAINTADAEVERIQSVLHDLVLLSPRNGRVQYQLARNGEVVAAGGKILTILDLTDVYMTIFLPAADAGKLENGGEARIILDPVPQYVIPATVSFVAADAQFTPKTVETRDERQKLMFRVKLKVDTQVLQRYYRRVKTGVRGIGIVRTNVAAAWPDDLQVKLPAQ